MKLTRIYNIIRIKTQHNLKRKNMPKCKAPIKIPYHINGLPCQIGVLTYNKVDHWKGPLYSCPSSDDYYGYTECEWELADRKGYCAEWLEKKLTDLQKTEIEIAIDEYFHDMKRFYDDV